MEDGAKADKRDPINVQIGRNIIRYRGDMSQVQLAELMTERGNRWSQATVWNTEQGNRPLKLKEAMDLAEILSVGLDALTIEETQGEFLAFLVNDLDELESSFTQAVDGMARLLWARDMIGQASIRALYEPESEMGGMPAEILQTFAEYMAEFTPANALFLAWVHDSRTENSYLISELKKKYGSEWIETALNGLTKTYGITVEPQRLEVEPASVQEIRRIFAAAALKLKRGK